MNKIPGAVKALIIANVIFYGIAQIPAIHDQMYELFAMYFPENENFHFWQVVTGMFMHASIYESGGFLHILLNMYALWAFGSPLEFMWKKNRFLIFYFISGIGAGVIYLLVNYYQFNSAYQEVIGMGLSVEEIQNLLATGNYNPSDSMRGNIDGVLLKDSLTKLYMLFNVPAVGASGAIYGVLVAFGMSFPNSKLALIFLPVPIPAKFFIPILIGIDLFSGVTGFSIFGGGVAHFAHVGGALVGFLLVWYWKVSGAIRVPVQYE
jgi:membrane associated rhomboid family serine protease